LIVVDTSLIVAFMNRGDSNHPAASAWIGQIRDDLVTSPLVLAEVDHLLTTRGGPAAARAFRKDLKAGAYLVDWWPGAISTTVSVADKYADLGLGLVDASLVALADHHGTTRVATFDHRHFRTVRPLRAAAAFQLLPAD
jgi:predicted nucleic acid-binding protein